MRPRRVLKVLALGALLGIGELAQSEDLLVLPGEQIVINGTRVLGVARVESAGEIRVKREAASDTQRSRLEIVATRIEIQDTARIDGTEAEGEPYQPAMPDNSGGYGGSYGGRGGAPAPEKRQPLHGNPDQPTIMRGSFGGHGPDQVIVGGLTGAALILRGERVILNGIINGNGSKGGDWSNNPSYPEPQRWFGAGGGSGGGILILAKTLTIGPNARITANGGNGGDGYGSFSCGEGYPGGGGRIKIFYEEGTISPAAVIESKKGSRPDYHEECGGDGGAEDGTVHIQQVRSIDQLLNPGDLNNDGVTNHEDLFLLQQSWQQELTPIPGPEETPTPTATPEP